MIKRNCNGCKALNFGTVLNCSLGYSNVFGLVKGLVVMEFKPTEPCPKPKTNKALAQCLRDQNET